VAVTCNKKDFHHRDHRITEEKSRLAIRGCVCPALSFLRRRHQAKKVFHRFEFLEAQNPLTAKNIEGYDALTVTNLVINGVWDGNAVSPQDGKLRASPDGPCLAIRR
jgi:hypothetical protein